MNIEWYKIPSQTKVNAYTQIAESTGIAPFAVEKDWWVVQVLSAIFEMEAGNHLIFKGGTSLSKAWRLIERFSEDIDLALDRSFLGFGKKLNRTQIKRLRQETGKYISGAFLPELKDIFEKKGIKDISFHYIAQKASDADPAKVEVHFPNVLEYPGYIPPRVLLEISSSSLREPKESRPIDSLLDEHYFESDFAELPINVPTAIPERTFLEKLFLLHEEFHRPQEKIRVNRLSRHLYDIYQLLKSEHALKAISDKQLYETIVKHRQEFNRMGGIDYNHHQPQTLNPLPIPEFMEAWDADYRLMQERMIYGDSPPFQIVVNAIKDFTERKINQLDWRMDIEFPIPE
jgi:hypothetical protein